MARRLPVVATPAGPAPPSKNSLIQAQLDGESAGREAARFGIDLTDLNVTEADLATGSFSVCDKVVQVARDYSNRRASSWRSSSPWKDPAPSGPLHEAFRAGFDHAVKERFACVCDPNVDEFDGLRRPRKRNRRR